MSTNAAERDLSVEEVNAALAKSMDRFARADVEGLVSRYADDVSIRFADLPEINGKVAAEQFLRERFKLQGDYKVSKALILVTGQKYANSFTASWTDKTTGRRYEARGVEAIQLKDGKVVRWDCAYNMWEAGKQVENSYFGRMI